MSASDPIPAFLLPRSLRVDKIWGGEDWILFDRDGKSTAFEGANLRELLERDPDLVLGGAKLDRFGRFPVMLKVIDANRRLSLQVHPGDALAADLGLADTGKTEAWVVLRAEPGATLVRGLQGSPDAVFTALESGQDPSAMLRFEPVEPGDVVDIPPGTVHCIGAGLALYEIQQNSDVTLRMHDWGRRGNDGKPRPLHLDASRRAVRATPGPVVVTPQREADGIELLVANDCFELRRVDATRVGHLATGGTCQIVTAVDARVQLDNGTESIELDSGGTCLVCASAGTFVVAADREPATVLVASPRPRC